MKRKVFRTGNSIVVSLPREALEVLGIAVGEEVSVELDKAARQLIIAPLPDDVNTDGVDAEFARQVANFIDEYRPALEALAR